MATPARSPAVVLFDTGRLPLQDVFVWSFSINCMATNGWTGMKLQLQYANIADTAADDFVSHSGVKANLMFLHCPLIQSWLER